MKNLDIGDTIPDIKLKDQNGEWFDLKSETESKNVVLYFYPKDNTHGCTAQACSFRDQITEFKLIDAEVIGISGQSVESHKEFAEEHNLPFTLLSDEGNKIRKKLGVPSNFLGLIPGRVTYVIAKKKMVVDIINSQISIKEHINESLKTLKESDLNSVN
jgi:peroxiredoxin Q/BCP